MAIKNKSLKILLIWLALFALVLLMDFVLPGTVVGIISKFLIMTMFALSLNLMVGYAGMMPLGQSVQLGIGAYAYTLLVRAGVSIGVSAAAAIAISVLAGAIIGYLCLRGGNGMTFAFLNMAIATLIYTIVNQTTFLGRDVGLPGAARPSFAVNTVGFGVMITIITMILGLVLYVLMHSPFESVVKGLRENEERLRFLGINTRQFQLVIYVIASLFAGISGILYAMYNQGAYPSFISTALATQGLMMCLIGGMSSFFGPALGAVIVTIIVTEVSNHTVYWQAVLGFIIIICVLFFRGGILGPQLKELIQKFRMKNAVKKGGDAHE